MQNILPPFDPKRFAPQVRSNQMDTYLRLARITSVDASRGVCDIEWLDHPGTRQNVAISLAGQGIYDIPVPGAIVLVAFDKGYNALIIRSLSQTFTSLTEFTNTQVPQLRKLHPGDKLFVSFRNPVDTNQIIPITSGAELLLTNSGDILMTNINGEYWSLSAEDMMITQNSVSHRIQTEAGILDFGLTKRSMPTESGQNETKILNTSGNPISVDERALTEFRLRVVETSDNDLTTAPEIETPLVELTLGTKIKEEGTTDSKIFSIERTDTSHAVEDQEIIIQLKTKADQGFEFTVDKQGNVTFKVNGAIKFNVDGNISLNVTPGSLVNVGGEDGEKVLLGETFQQRFNNLVKYVNGLAYVNTAGVVTPCIQGPAAGFAQLSNSNDLSPKVKTE